MPRAPPSRLPRASLAVFGQKFVRTDLFLPNVSILTNWHFPTATFPLPTQTRSWSRSCPAWNSSCFQSLT